MAANKKERKVNSLQPSDSTIVKYILLAGGETGSLTSPGSRAINMRSRREDIPHLGHKACHTGGTEMLFDGEKQVPPRLQGLIMKWWNLLMVRFYSKNILWFFLFCYIFTVEIIIC